MKFSLEFNNEASAPIEKEFFFCLFGNLKKSEIFQDFFGLDKNLEVSLALVSGEKIRKINKEYRKNDKATDILSFSEFENLNQIKSQKEENLFLGELILCYDDIKKFTQEMNLKLKEELEKVFIHGILHLLGLIHGEEMFELQKKLTQKNGENKEI